MSHLPAEYDSEIRSYLEVVEAHLKKLDESDGGRCIVHDADWLTPSIGGLPFPGSLTERDYFNRIRDALRIGLKRGIIPNEYAGVLLRAPERIRGLLMNEPFFIA